MGDPEILYHYTTATGPMGIIQSQAFVYKHLSLFGPRPWGELVRSPTGSSFLRDDRRGSWNRGRSHRGGGVLGIRVHKPADW